MTFLHDVFLYFNDPLNWRGTNGITNRLVEHLGLSLSSMLIACLIAVPGGVLLGRSRRRGALAVNIANIGRAVPSFALIALGVIWLGIGVRPALIALVLLALPPVFTLTFTAVRGVDAATVDAARGMGMTRGRLLRKVQLPMALPLVLNGIRLSSSAVIATASLASLVSWGGLGRFIVDGFAIRDFVQVVVGVVLIAALVLLNEVLFAVIGRLAISPGLRRSGTSRARLRRAPA